MFARMSVLISLLLGLTAFVRFSAKDAPTVELVEGKSLVEETDPELEKWFKVHSDDVGVVSLSDEAFKAKMATIQNKGAVLYAETMRKKTLSDADLKDIEAKLPDIGPEWASYVADMVRRKVKGANLSRYWVDLNLKQKSRTCAMQSAVLQNVRYAPLQTFDKSYLVDKMNLIQSFESARFKREAMRAILDRFRQKPKDEHLATLVIEYGQDYPTLLRNLSWTKQLTAAPQAPKTKFDAISGEADELVRKKHCASAEQLIVKNVSGQANPLSFDEASALTRSVDRCFRASRSLANRIKYWERVEVVLAKAYGHNGASFAKMNRGILLAYNEKYVEARQLLKTVMTLDSKELMPELRIEAQYKLVQIEIESGDKEAGRLALVEFIAFKPEDVEKTADAFRSLIIMDFESKKYVEVQKWLSSFEEVLMDSPSRESDVGFVQFWRARTYAAQGMTNNAIEVLKLMAAKYFSHFYGAMAHLYLEKMTGKDYGIKRVKAPKFDESWVTNSFAKEEHARATLISDLLKMGMSREARCELDEIVAVGHREHAAKALLLHASNDWLGSVMELNDIPLVHRHLLFPIGFESVIFPMKYQDMVEQFAKKIGLDDHLIFAVIRQESVFDPRAESPVGARGLMQLMPATARGEVKQFGKNYVASDVLKDISHRVKTSNNLFDPELNLSIGIHHLHNLLKRYNNPLMVLAAYNANPKAADKWRKELPTEDWLIFAESIPYKETRLYVKLVMRNYFYYKRWYSREDFDYAYFDGLSDPILEKNKAGTTH